MSRQLPESTLFPYTTLFRSVHALQGNGDSGVGGGAAGDRGEGLREDRRVVQRRVAGDAERSEEHTSELQSPCNLVCRLLLEKKKERRVDQLCQRGGEKGYPR